MVLFFRSLVLTSELERDDLFVVDAESFWQTNNVVDVRLIHDVVESAMVALFADVEVSDMVELVAEVGVADWHCISGHLDNDWLVLFVSISDFCLDLFDGALCVGLLDAVSNESTQLYSNKPLLCPISEL